MIALRDNAPMIAVAEGNVSMALVNAIMVGLGQIAHRHNAGPIALAMAVACKIPYTTLAVTLDLNFYASVTRVGGGSDVI